MSMFRSVSSHSTQSLWLLGVKYEAPEDDAAMKRHVRTRFWFTYRNNFIPIGNTSYTSDAGWGCMLRCGQMILAQAMVCHTLGRAWRAQGDAKATELASQILRHFLDTPLCPFSIHRIAEQGKMMSKSIGQWFGPNTMAQVIKQLVGAHPVGFAVHVAMDSVLHMGDLAASIQSARASARIARSRAASTDTDFLASSLCTSDDDRTLSPVLILVPLRLGLAELNDRYVPYLRDHFAMPQSIGFIGGKPNSAYYFMGIHGDRVLYLDPHSVQIAVTQSGRKSKDRETFHCDGAKSMNIFDIDPSLCLGFYCANDAEVLDLVERVKAQKEKVSRVGVSPLFSVTEMAKRKGGDLSGSDGSDMLRRYEGGEGGRVLAVSGGVGSINSALDDLSLSETSTAGSGSVHSMVGGAALYVSSPAVASSGGVSGSSITVASGAVMGSRAPRRMVVDTAEVCDEEADLTAVYQSQTSVGASGASDSSARVASDAGAYNSTVSVGADAEIEDDWELM